MGQGQSKIIGNEPPGHIKDALKIWQNKLPPQDFKGDIAWRNPDVLEKLIAIRKEKFKSTIKIEAREEIQSQIAQLQEGLDNLKASEHKKQKEANAEKQRIAKIPDNIKKAIHLGYTAQIPTVGTCYEWFNTLSLPGEPETKYIGKCIDSRLHHTGQYGEEPTRWTYNFEDLTMYSLSDPYAEPVVQPRNYLKLADTCEPVSTGGRRRRKGTRRRRTNKTNKRVKVN